jgi:chromate transporter
MTAVLEVLWSFTKVGLVGFGGGPAMIPLLQAEIVTVRGWLSNEAFIDAFAFGNALPGPIATKLAGYVGYHVAGVPGAIAGLAGITLPTIVAMVTLFAVYGRFKHHGSVQAFLEGVRPVVLALLALVAWEFLPAAMPQTGQQLLWATLIALAAVIASLRFRVHPAWLIPLGGLAGLVLLYG